MQQKTDYLVFSADFETILSAGTGVCFINSSVLIKVGGSSRSSVISKRRSPKYFSRHTNTTQSTQIIRRLCNFYLRRTNHKMAQNGHSHNSFTNYVAYRDPKLLGQSRIGHLELESSTIQPLSFTSGAPISDLYQVIEVGGSQIKPAGEKFPLSSVELLAPIYGRDVLAVGKNYAEHAVEFNTSGYDSSDKVDQPTHPVIFTKRATSIIASEEAIYPHDGFTETLDYEGEIGVIIGKSGFKIEEADAMEHVWGYTIINDMTARERQRDHKQFYIGKSADTLCPMVRTIHFVLT